MSARLLGSGCHSRKPLVEDAVLSPALVRRVVGELATPRQTHNERSDPEPLEDPPPGRLEHRLGESTELFTRLTAVVILEQDSVGQHHTDVRLVVLLRLPHALQPRRQVSLQGFRVETTLVRAVHVDEELTVRRADVLQRLPVEITRVHLRLLAAADGSKRLVTVELQATAATAAVADVTLHQANLAGTRGNELVRHVLGPQHRQIPLLSHEHSAAVLIPEGRDVPSHDGSTVLHPTLRERRPAALELILPPGLNIEVKASGAAARELSCGLRNGVEIADIRNGGRVH